MKEGFLKDREREGKNLKERERGRRFGLQYGGGRSLREEGRRKRKEKNLKK